MSVKIRLIRSLAMIRTAIMTKLDIAIKAKNSVALSISPCGGRDMVFWVVIVSIHERKWETRFGFARKMMPTTKRKPLFLWHSLLFRVVC